MTHSHKDQFLKAEIEKDNIKVRGSRPVDDKYGSPELLDSSGAQLKPAGIKELNYWIHAAGSLFWRGAKI